MKRFKLPEGMDGFGDVPDHVIQKLLALEEEIFTLATDHGFFHLSQTAFPVKYVDNGFSIKMGVSHNTTPMHATAMLDFAIAQFITGTREKQ